MKTISWEIVPKLVERPVIVGFDGGYIAHEEPCDNPEQFKVRYSAQGHDVIRTFERPS